MILIKGISRSLSNYFGAGLCKAISTVFALMLFFAGSFTVRSQVSSYTFTESLSGSGYVPLTGVPTVAYAAPWDDHVAGAAHQATIPFTFVYDGISYTQCFISPNGFITFSAVQPANINIAPLSTTGTYAGAVCPMGIDLISNGSAIVYSTVGVSPNREFVIQWTNAVRKVDSGDFNFQIRLKEGSNIIEFMYGVCSTISITNRPVQVGLRGPNVIFAQGNVNNRSQITNSVWFGNTAAGTLNTSSVRTLNTAYPDLAMSYKWTPAATCTVPTGVPSGLVLGATSINNTSINGNSFIAAAPTPTNYLVLRSTVNTPPTSVQVPNRTFGVVGSLMGAYTVVSISNATTFVQTGLVASTTYYYWVIPYNSNCAGAPYYNLGSMLSGNATTCLAPIVALAASSVGGNDFAANWNLSAGATDYRIDVATDAAFTAIVPGYNNLSTGNVSSITVTGLASFTTYYYRIRALGTGCGVNSNTITVATVCGSYPIPYFQNFDTTALAAVPACFTRIDSNADAIQWGTQSITYASSPKSLFIAKNSGQAMDDWFMVPGLNLTGGISYRLFFRYNTNSTASMTENLKVRLGTSATIVSMTQTLLDLSNINNTTFKSVFVDFTPVTSGVYYIGYQGYSLANQSYIAIDDISVTVSPTCFEPTDLLASPIGITTATVSWIPPVPEPANGFEYYLSTSATVPTSGTVPTGSVGSGIYTINLVGLTASSSYYIWIRGNCGAVDKSIWSLEETFSTECNTPFIVSSTPSTRCGYGTSTLNAVPNTGSIINWYTAATGGSPLFTGNSFITPSLSVTTTYYIEAKAFGAIAKTGPSSPTNEGGTVGVQNFQSYASFNVSSNTTLQSIDIFPYASGQAGTLIVRNATNVTMATIPFVTAVAGGGIVQVIPIGYVFAAGNYNLYISVMPASGIAMNTANAFYPYTSAVASITGNPLDNTQYLGFYNWKFTTECLSGRIPITATVTTPPALTISSNASTVCEGTSTGLVTISGYGSYNNLVWSPLTGISGSFAGGFTFNPTVTTTYTMTASQTSGSFCSNIVTHTVTVNAVPAAVMIIPSNVTICQNTIQPLNGSVGAAMAVPVLEQNFNGGTNDWIVGNTSLIGDTAASQWTLHNSTYTYGSPTWNVSVKSNDNSQFYFANSDPQGSSTMPNILTKTTLQSPNFSLVGATSAYVTFWHYMRYISGDLFQVQVSTDSGASWTTVQQYNSTQGTALVFVNPTINLNAYIGNANVCIRFNFNSNWGYGWAIDNVTVAATMALALSWSPATYLYNDAAATVPYTLGTAVPIVYSKPSATITYTATATGFNGCTSSNLTTISVDSLPLGGMISSSQILCGGLTPSNLVLGGYNGGIVRWEYADDAAFTVNVTIIANTTNTLTPAQMGVIGAIRYFRAVVKSGVCAQIYSNVVSISYPNTSWNGSIWSNGVPNFGLKAIFNGNYSSTGDLQACSVQVLSGTVAINATHNLIVTNEVTVSGGSLDFADTSSLVQTGSSSSNSGNIIYRRNTTPVRKYDYTYWSTPVSPQTLVAFSANTLSDKFFTYNSAANAWLNVASSSVMTPGRGYIIRTPDIAPFNTITTNIFNGSFNGVPNNGNISVSIVGGANQLNLLGNPYPSALSANAFLSNPGNAAVLDGTIYLWTHNTAITANQYASNDYAVYNYSGGTGTSAINGGINNGVPNGKIAAGQGFFVKGLASGTASYTNSMRVVGNNDQFFRMASGTVNADLPELERNRIWLDISNAQGAYKQTMVGYIETATNGIDRGFDGDMVDAGNPINLYSLLNTTKLSIQGRGLPFDINDRVPIGYKSTAAAGYTINLFQFDGLFTDQNINIYLEDTALNVIHDLRSGGYDFVTNAGTFDSRFVLRFTDSSLGASSQVFDNNSMVVYKKDKLWIVDSGKNTMKNIAVYDVKGRLLVDQKGVHSTTAMFDAGETNQVLLVQITSEDGIVVTKKIIN